MKRIDIHYAGQIYSVGGREFDVLQNEITDGLASGGPSWLVVNDGEGHRRDAYLLLTPGAPLTLIPVPDELPA